MPANEPDSGAKPPFPHLLERPGASWRKHKKSREVDLSREETSLPSLAREIVGFVAPIGPDFGGVETRT